MIYDKCVQNWKLIHFDVHAEGWCGRRGQMSVAVEANIDTSLLCEPSNY